MKAFMIVISIVWSVVGSAGEFSIIEFQGADLGEVSALAETLPYVLFSAEEFKLLEATEPFWRQMGITTPKAHFEAFIQSPKYLSFIARTKDGKIVGFVNLTKDSTDANDETFFVVQTIGVDPKIQRGGLASKLLLHIEAVILERLPGELVGREFSIKAFVKADNKASRGLFLKNGYAQVMEIPGYGIFFNKKMVKHSKNAVLNHP